MLHAVRGVASFDMQPRVDVLCDTGFALLTPSIRLTNIDWTCCPIHDPILKLCQIAFQS